MPEGQISHGVEFIGRLKRSSGSDPHPANTPPEAAEPCTTCHFDDNLNGGWLTCEILNRLYKKCSLVVQPIDRYVPLQKKSKLTEFQYRNQGW